MPENATPSPARYRQIYALIAGIMLVSPVTAFVLNSLVGTRGSYIFFIEAAGIWAFALYWWVKSAELKRSAATAKALRAEIETEAGRSGGPLKQSVKQEGAGEQEEAAVPGGGGNLRG